MWRNWRLTRTAEPVKKQVKAEPIDHLLRRLQWTVLRPLATRLGGDEPSLYRGPGMELSELREYQPGDDVRHIDWNVSARTDRPFIREAQVERALDLWLIADLSASLDWGTAECLKRDRAVEFAAVAGQLMSRHGHRVGALLFADRPLALVPPAHGHTHLRRMLSALRDEPRRDGNGPTDLRAALLKAQSLIRRPSLVLVVSDFLVTDGWQAPMGRLAQRHEVVAIRMHDPREAELPDVGLITVEDPETGLQIQVDTRHRKLREQFAAAAQAQIDRLRADLTSCGAERLDLSTDSGLLPVLVRFLNARRVKRSLGVRQQALGNRLAALSGKA